MERTKCAVSITVLVVAGLAGCSATNRAAPRVVPSTSPATNATTTSSGRVATTQMPTTSTPPETRATTLPTAVPTTSGRPATPARVVRRGDDRRRWIALTFDAGSDAGHTAAILDVLAVRHVRATFSLTGAFVRANPALALRIARAGHVIVNHTDTHESFTGYSTNTRPLSSSERVTQLARADAAIAAVTGESTRPWFRPPYGDIDEATAADAARAGYSYVLLWTVDSLGWKGQPPAAVAARCLDGATPGGILLFHVGSASTDAAAIPAVIEGLRARGYQMVTVAEPGFVAG